MKLFERVINLLSEHGISKQGHVLVIESIKGEMSNRLWKPWQEEQILSS